MTAEEFASLLSLLDPDRERAAELYEETRRKLIRLFEWRACEFPEELADETLDRVAKRLAGGLQIEAKDPYSFFCGVAYRLYQEVLRANAKKRQALSSGDWPPPDAPEEESEDRRLTCIRTCLDRLPAEQRQLILDYHAGDDRIRSRQQLSERLGIPTNALRIRVHRVRRLLGECLDQCLERSKDLRRK